MENEDSTYNIVRGARNNPTCFYSYETNVCGRLWQSGKHSPARQGSAQDHLPAPCRRLGAKRPETSPVSPAKFGSANWQSAHKDLTKFHEFLSQRRRHAPGVDTRRTGIACPRDLSLMTMLVSMHRHSYYRRPKFDEYVCNLASTPACKARRYGTCRGNQDQGITTRAGRPLGRRVGACEKVRQNYDRIEPMAVTPFGRPIPPSPPDFNWSYILGNRGALHSQAMSFPKSVWVDPIRAHEQEVGKYEARRQYWC